MVNDEQRSMWDRYTVSLTKVPGAAITLIMAGILLPAAIHAVKLGNDETPANLLVSICISLFAGVIFLWILDAVSILPFRSQWVSKSVYAAAIVSVLGTSVAVYADFFSSRKYPFEGAWALQYTDGDYVKRTNVIMMYSNQSRAYWGYSEFDDRDQKDKDAVIWIKIDDFDPKAAEIRLQLYKSSKKIADENYRLTIEREGALLRSDKPNPDKLRLSRPN
jgi:hypothetical protein